jgi:LysR family transcriptional regulator, chromosome initiation inhibitor
MLDYALLGALAAVSRYGSFERAARELNVTPSAISQRIKTLEERVGSVLIKRGQPCVPTASGALLREHAERVQLMEAELGARVPALLGSRVETIPSFRVAVNDDSVSTWFIEAVADFCIERKILLELVIDDQDHTAQFIRDGSVQGAVTTEAEAVQGWRSIRLGRMQYVAVCSPDYFGRNFSAGVNRQSLRDAPRVNFTPKDEMQKRFIRRITRADLNPPTHHVPHGLGFLRACTTGLAWGMCPIQMVEPLLFEGTLVELVAGTHVDVDLYWQSWRLSIGWLDDFSALLRQRAASILA